MQTLLQSSLRLVIISEEVSIDLVHFWSDVESSEAAPLRWTSASQHADLVMPKHFVDRFLLAELIVLGIGGRVVGCQHELYFSLKFLSLLYVKKIKKSSYPHMAVRGDKKSCKFSGLPIPCSFLTCTLWVQVDVDVPVATGRSLCSLVYFAQVWVHVPNFTLCLCAWVLYFLRKDKDIQI